MANKDEVVEKINDIINDLMDLSVQIEFGSWEKFNKYIGEVYLSNEGVNESRTKWYTRSNIQ